MDHESSPPEGPWGSGWSLGSHLCDEAVELLLGPEPLDLLVDPLVLLQLLQVCPATVQVRTDTHTHSVSFHSDRVGYVLISKLSSNMVKKAQTARYSQALKLDVELLHLQILPRLQLERHKDNNERLQEQKCHCDAICGVMPGNQCSRQH